eukprot:1359011-Amorphochlora_amoeboformis.AAC.1
MAGYVSKTDSPPGTPEFTRESSGILTGDSWELRASLLGISRPSTKPRLAFGRYTRRRRGGWARMFRRKEYGVIIDTFDEKIKEKKFLEAVSEEELMYYLDQDDLRVNEIGESSKSPAAFKLSNSLSRYVLFRCWIRHHHIELRQVGGFMGGSWEGDQGDSAQESHGSY